MCSTPTRNVETSTITLTTTEAQRSHREPLRETLDNLVLIHMLDSFSQSFSRAERTPELARLDSCRALTFSRDREGRAHCLVIRIAQFDQATGRLLQVRFGNDFVGRGTRSVEDWPQFLSQGSDLVLIANRVFPDHREPFRLSFRGEPTHLFGGKTSDQFLQS